MHEFYNAGSRGRVSPRARSYRARRRRSRAAMIATLLFRARFALAFAALAAGFVRGYRKTR